MLVWRSACCVTSKDEGVFASIDPHIASHAFVGMCRHYVTMHVIHSGKEPPHDKTEIDDVFPDKELLAHTLTELFLNGMKKA